MLGSSVRFLTDQSELKHLFLRHSWHLLKAMNVVTHDDRHSKIELYLLCLWHLPMSYPKSLCSLDECNIASCFSAISPITCSMEFKSSQSEEHKQKKHKGNRSMRTGYRGRRDHGQLWSLSKWVPLNGVICVQIEERQSVNTLRLESVIEHEIKQAQDCSFKSH